MVAAVGIYAVTSLIEHRDDIANWLHSL
jgi:hypothetical protein